MRLAGKTVVLCVTGGIAAYKAADLTSKLRHAGAAVRVLMTESATQFISPMTFETLSGNRTVVDTFDRNFAWEVEHISLAKAADVFVIAPATANVIAKAAHGIADDMVTTTLLATKAPVVIAPAMNTGMYDNPVTQQNLQTLRMRENVPHIPALEERARREYAGACAMVENMDWNMGRIRNKLWETGLAENTHILFFSDHGDMHGSHGMFLKTHPYEESLRIPFVIGGASHYAGVTRARVDYPINHVDIAPTTLGLCGIRPPEWMQGTDYSAARLGGTVQNAPDSAYIQKNVETPTGYGTQFPWRGIVTRDGWKYVCLAGTPYLMFNLNEDPLEQHNMALNSFFSAKRRELNERLRRWVEETGDDFLLPKL